MRRAARVARPSARRAARGLGASSAQLVGRERELAAGREARRRRPRGRGRHPVRHRRGGDRQDAPPRRAAGGVRARGAASAAARSGSRAAASPTASRCRTGRSGTSSARLARRRGRRAGAPRPRGAPPAASTGCSATGALEIYPYLGALLGLSLEPDAAARLAELSPEALQYRTFEVVRDASRAPRRGRARRRRAGGPALGRRDVAPAAASGCSAGRDGPRVLLVVAQRARARPPVLAAEGGGAARAPPPHPRARRSRRCPGDAERELLHALVGERNAPAEMERRVLDRRRETRSTWRSSSARSSTPGALVHDEEGWRFDHAVPVEIPPTVEKVILARIDRLEPECARRADGRVGARPPVRLCRSSRAWPATAAPQDAAPRAPAARPGPRRPPVAASRSTASSTR